MNQVIISGRICKDIEVRYTPSQIAVAEFAVALDRGKDKDGNDKGADFPRCIAFGKTAEFLEKWTNKGNRVAVVGHIQTGSYEKDGIKHYATDIIVDKAEVIDWKERAQSDFVPEGFAVLDEETPF